MTTANAIVAAAAGASQASEPLERVYLYPGQILVSARPLIVTTILGSCVAVCLWDPTARVAGINHYLLPENPGSARMDLRYGNTAIQRLIDEMLASGARQHRILAKLFGGASILTPSSGSRISIGEQNVIAGRKYLAQHAINISGEATGGARGRKLLFQTGTGRNECREI